MNGITSNPLTSPQIQGENMVEKDVHELMADHAEELTFFKSEEMAQKMWRWSRFSQARAERSKSRWRSRLEDAEESDSWDDGLQPRLGKAPQRRSYYKRDQNKS